MQKFPSEYGASLVVAERDRKTIFFLCSVSMVKKVKDGGEWERGSARRAHITWNKVKLIETNCSSARASFTVNEICIVFVWKQAKRLAFFFLFFFRCCCFWFRNFACSSTIWLSICSVVRCVLNSKIGFSLYWLQPESNKNVKRKCLINSTLTQEAGQWAAYAMFALMNRSRNGKKT